MSDMIGIGIDRAFPIIALASRFVFEGHGLFDICLDGGLLSALGLLWVIPALQFAGAENREDESSETVCGR